MSAVEVLRSARIAVPHGFLGRRGGTSSGPMWGLNTGLGSGDDPAVVAENRRRAAAAVLPGARLVGVYQVHGADAVVAGGWSDAERPHADALVTDRPGVLLSILTADCAPVLFADAEAGVVGAAHAGWKGALGRVVEATVARMEALGARRERIAAAVGPCIAAPSYEVDEAFRARFRAADEGFDRFFSPGPAGKPHFDLPGFVAARAAAAGLGAVEALGEDTYAQEKRFYSFRRATHRAEPSYGRQLSLIGLAAD
ncbi:peptidoglycan editing factor PgeF [Sphingomonas ginkgonis]|uniref:Purine nucleoside phosphorylase n=1 Tax=Sphingomonas ginkgonis TaxID=2315330 RepID=A0A429V802_9SPHN|nr:peptidoglycan editing factor PgeF [Sphingomonas ginkgonis]RST30078.1 peptidoglycan editing factor PgeF [Sphingomonas ginkgonis]